ncbi:MAG: hypothetical protein R2852_01765 [Bacteroidia bacterium]
MLPLSILLQVPIDTTSLVDANAKANELPTGLWELTLTGGIVMIPIAAMLIIAIFIAIERWLSISKATVNLTITLSLTSKTWY